MRTGVTAILPHEDSLYLEPVPAGLSVATASAVHWLHPVERTRELETPILLTNTLSAPRGRPYPLGTGTDRHDGIKTVSPVVGECNDGVLNDIRRPTITDTHVRQALDRSRWPGC